MKRPILLICLVFFKQFVLFSQNEKPVKGAEDVYKTVFERTNYQQTGDYEETIRFCRQLDAASDIIKYTTFGKSPQGRDLPLLIIDKNKNFTSDDVRNTDNLVVLIQAGIHAGEIDGKDAGLMLLRDIGVIGENKSLLDKVTILFIPVYNVDGFANFGPFNRINQNGPTETGWRTTASNLNLNRDYLKADAPETQAWLKLFIDWLPDFFIDIHATDGADYQYATTYSMETHENMYFGIAAWESNVFIKKLTANMNSAGTPIFPYVAFRSWHDPKSGLASWVSNPMLSTGYTAIQNRPGLLIENHMLKDYKTRVFASYNMIVESLKILNKEASVLRSLVRDADNYVLSTEFKRHPFPLTFKNTGDSVMVDFKGFEYTSETSDLTGGIWYKYSNKPKTFKLPYFNTLEPDITVLPPEVYIIPAEWVSVIRKLEDHGVVINYIHDTFSAKVKSYRLSNVNFNEKPYEGHQIASFNAEEIEEWRTFSPGSAWIEVSQKSARVIIYALEPKSPDSYIHWGFFNSIFEQKEYGESYVLEKIAREMILKNPALKEEFEKKKSEDQAFAKDQFAQLNWFYSKTEYWDTRINLYPIGRIYDKDIVDELKN